MPDATDDGEWYEIVALFQDGEVIEEGGTQIVGKIDDVTIVQINTNGMPYSQVKQAIAATASMLKESGIEKALIVHDGVRMMRLRKVSPERAKELRLASEEKTH